jgi:hypothetical protein
MPAAARTDPLPGDSPWTARHAADQCRLPLQPVLRALPCRREPAPHRGDERRDRRHSSSVSRPAAHRRARHHRRRAGAEPAFPAHRHDRPRHGRACDGPLQPHHHGGWRPAGPAGVSRPPAGRDRGLDAVLSRGQRGPPARQGRVRRLDPRIAAAQRAGLRPRRLGARAQPRLQSAGAVAAAAAGGAGGRLQARAGCRPRRRVQPALYAGQHADPAVRLDADLQESVRQLSRPAAARASRRQSRRRDVPEPHLGGLARRGVRLRLQPDARPADGARREASRASVRTHGCNPRRQSGPCLRTLFRLHGRSGIELRRPQRETCCCSCMPTRRCRRKPT